jgi:hypothetical protein
MILQRRPCTKTSESSNSVCFSAVCGICDLLNYVCVNSEGVVLRKDLCQHNIKQDLKHMAFTFTNDRRSRRK